MQFGQVIKRNPGEIVVLEVIVGPEKGVVPEPARFDQSAPLGRIFRPDIVMLSQAVEGKRYREYEK